MKVNTYDIFSDVLKKYTIKKISEELFIHTGTIKRWIESKKIPDYYYFDLCGMLDINIDYSKLSEREKDQFYTPNKTSKYCIDKTFNILKSLSININDFYFIEPAAGDGSFSKLLPNNKTIAIDIEPKYEGVIEKNFLKWKPSDYSKKYITIGNPPFGFRGNLALRFINHAGNFSDFVCFILPQLFNSNGKGSCKKRVKNLSLIHNEIISPNFYYPSGKDVKVNVVFQIWSKIHKNYEKDINLDGYIKLYSLSDGGTPSSTRNKKYLNICDYYLPSTCWEKNMKLYYNFKDLPQKRGYGIIVLSNKNKLSKIIENIEWSKKSFKSTNGALNLRFDIIKNTMFEEIEKERKKIINCFFN